jgi:subtilisin family serine protease
MKRFITGALILSSLLINGQTNKRPDNWFNLDPTNDKVNGVSTERTYNELLKNKKSTTVIVGVIDSGVDFNHEDLKAVMWSNPGEIPGNNIDDDKNGYVDDIHGWNFIGGKDGKNVDADNLEMTRLLRKLKPKYDGKSEADFKSKEEKKEFK